MKKSILVVLAILLCTICNLFSQVIPTDIVDRINRAQYIFEGQVIRVDGYWNDHHSYIYRSLTLDIRKKFKGDITCGTIELILLGGRVGNMLLDVSHNLELKVGDKGIFLCKETDREQSTVDFFQESNYKVLETVFNAQGFIRILEDGVNPQVVDYWQFRLDSLSQAYNMVELYTQLQYVDCYPMPSPMITNNSDLMVASSIDTSLTISLTNPLLITYQGHKAYAFDISLSDSLNNLYFSYFAMRLTYDTSTFGPSIATNGRVHIFPYQFLNDTSTYSINPISIQDIINQGSNVVQVNSHFNPHTNNVTYNFLPLSNSMTPIARIIMEIKDCNTSSVIIPSANFIACHYTFSPTQSPANIPPYKKTYCLDTLNFGGCGTRYITSISPDFVHGGTGDTVTITGYGFGTRTDTATVYLKSANINMDIHIDTNDILSWSNTIIKFRVPSMLNNILDYPGSGYLSVHTDSGGFVITYIYSWLTIYYSVENVYSTDLDEKLYCNLSPLSDKAFHGFIFRPDSFFSHFPDKLLCLDKAIHQWVCATGVNFKLGTDTNYNDMFYSKDTINTISFQSLDSSILGLTNTWKGISLSNCNKAYIVEIDIAFNKNPQTPFLVDTIKTNSIPADTADFYETVLHELGHGMGISHVNDPSALMYPEARSHGVSAADRNIDLSNESSASDCGIYIVNKSISLDLINCPLLNKIFLGTSYLCVNGINDPDVTNFSFELFPNPSSEIINISYELDHGSNTIMSILDISNRICYTKSTYKQKGENIENISIANLENGYYILVIQIGKYKYVKKFVKLL